jgi:energy-converting hydrogenase Eha subunit C
MDALLAAFWVVLGFVCVIIAAGHFEEAFGSAAATGIIFALVGHVLMIAGFRRLD